MTPTIPCWIRDADITGYKNAYKVLEEICPEYREETRLYGTESMYGDWDARVLLLAQDFAPISYLSSQKNEGKKCLYSHCPTLPTNKNLEAHIDSLTNKPVPGQGHESCGILYGSAMANMMIDSDQMSNALPSWTIARCYGTRVLKDFVFPSMDNLELIVPMGGKAWECVMGAAGTKESVARLHQWKKYRDQYEPVRFVPREKTVTVCSTFHTSPRSENRKSLKDERKRLWRRVDEHLLVEKE